MDECGWVNGLEDGDSNSRYGERQSNEREAGLRGRSKVEGKWGLRTPCPFSHKRGNIGFSGNQWHNSLFKMMKNYTTTTSREDTFTIDNKEAQIFSIDTYYIKIIENCT